MFSLVWNYFLSLVFVCWSQVLALLHRCSIDAHNKNYWAGDHKVMMTMRSFPFPFQLIILITHVSIQPQDFRNFSKAPKVVLLLVRTVGRNLNSDSPRNTLLYSLSSLIHSLWLFFSLFVSMNLKKTNVLWSWLFVSAVSNALLQQLASFYCKKWSSTIPVIDPNIIRVRLWWWW